MKCLKKLFSILISVALFLPVLLTPALAAGLAPTRSYGEAEFTDVSSDWTYVPIKTCFELGLMSGQGPGIFDPGGTVSLAEGVTVTARIHDLWRGGAGVFPDSTPWYQSAVDYAVRHGIVTQNQFSDYNAAATRAQLAEMLALALLEKDYVRINSVTELPDVTDSTPGAAAIFKLYNTGILSGMDAYGTFSPDSTITRAEMAAMLCRLAQPETRLTFTLQPKPADLTVRASNKRLVINGRPFCGLVEIGGEAYLPLAMHEGNDAPMSRFLSYYDYNGDIRISYYTRHLPAVLPDYTDIPVQGSTMGTAQPGPAAIVTYEGSNEEQTVPLLTLDGHFPMIKVSSLFPGSVKDQGGTITVELPIARNSSPSDLQREPDLVGEALSGLLRSSPRETALAIHDYLVNTLTYEPYTETSEAAYESAAERYQLEHNRALACKYGVCQDYSELFQEMCLRAGIPCEFVSGSGNGGSHGWNRVYVDGTWSYVDCTWDDPVGKEPVLLHDYFLADAEHMAIKHYWDEDDYPMPKEYDPAWEQLDANNITDADMFRKCLVAQLMQKKEFISLKVTRSGAYGGLGCIYAYDLWWFQISGGYNSKTQRYEYTVEY